MKHLNSLNILSKCQYGFHAKHSTELQLLRIAHDFASNLKKRIQTDAVLLDLTKAFDKVPHHFLLHKLEYYGIRKQTLEWLSGQSDSVHYL